MSIFVLGMHRSGTSVVTKLLELMGAYVGDTTELLPPSPDNPKGFFERRDALAVNQGIFKLHGCNWYQVERYDSPCPPLPDEIKQRMSMIVSRLSQHPVWALKDPRLCFTLPDWLPHTHAPTIVTVSRHPAEIAQSLALRNNILFQDGLLLWQRYIEHAIANTQGLRVVKCDYAAIIQNPVAEAEKLFTQLVQHHPDIHAPSTAEIQRFVDPALKRAVHRTDINPAQMVLFDQWRL